MKTIGAKVLGSLLAAAALSILSSCVEASVPVRTVYVEPECTVYVEGGRAVYAEPIQPSPVR
jgi:hypothetical protein